MVEDCFRRGVQLFAHANGDAAAEQLIRAVAAAEAKLGRADRRPVMIHAQTVRDDQLDRMKELGIFPSFFSAHCFYWGDWHVSSVLGRERADRISPARSAADRGLRFSIHNDPPVVRPSMTRAARRLRRPAGSEKFGWEWDGLCSRSGRMQSNFEFVAMPRRGTQRP